MASEVLDMIGYSLNKRTSSICRKTWSSRSVRDSTSTFRQGSCLPPKFSVGGAGIQFFQGLLEPVFRRGDGVDAEIQIENEMKSQRTAHLNGLQMRFQILPDSSDLNVKNLGS